MDKIEITDPQLCDAIVLWTGWLQVATPRRDQLKLAERFGKEEASRLMREIKTLEDDFYASQARFIAADLQKMHELAIHDFKGLHPKVPDTIAQAFAWCYTYDYK